MNKSLFVALVCCIPFCTALYGAPNANNTKIEQLEEEKRVMQSRADFAGREADRLMFQDWLGYRAHLEAQTRYLNEVKVLQEKIDQLKAEQKK